MIEEYKKIISNEDNLFSFSKSIFSKFDLDKDGKIEYSELIKLYSKLAKDANIDIFCNNTKPLELDTYSKKKSIGF